QRSVGLAVVSSLCTIYGALLAVPLVIQRGKPVGEEVEAFAAVGALHPIFTLVTWGDARVFGVAVPGWLLAVLFHALVALPLVAGAAEGQRAAGAPRGRATRAAFLAFFVYAVGLATGAAWERSPEVRALVGSCVALLLLVFASMRASLAPPPRSPFG